MRFALGLIILMFSERPCVVGFALFLIIWGCADAIDERVKRVENMIQKMQEDAQ